MKFLIQDEDYETEKYIERIGDNLKIESIDEIFDEEYPVNVGYDIVTLYSADDLVKLQNLLSCEGEHISITLDDKLYYTKEYGKIPLLRIKARKE